MGGSTQSSEKEKCHQPRQPGQPPRSPSHPEGHPNLRRVAGTAVILVLVDSGESCGLGGEESSLGPTQVLESPGERKTGLSTKGGAT